jgi:regulator of protease activity HflC (stomatin/prohibitin superfamily)
MSSNDEPAREADARSKTGRSVLAWTLGVLLGAVLLTATWIGLSAGVSAYRRAEQRANAENLVRLAHIQIRRAEQQALVARAEVATAKADAEKQYQKAVGVRRSQETIMSGLTPRYLQYEAIQAQKAVATSGRNNTLIYLPSGSGGVPLVQDPQTVSRLKP